MITAGIDLGSSRLRIALFDDDKELERVDAPGLAMRAGRGEQLTGMIVTLTRPLLNRSGITRLDQLTVGAAGAGGEAERLELQHAMESSRIAWRTVVTTDAELARRAAFGFNPGILLVAGTGSIAVGIDQEGAAIRRGGLGWRMGDLGSGYWIGSEALVAVGAMYDQNGANTRLMELLPGKIGAPGVAGLIRWSTQASTSQVASLASVVLEAARQGDDVARRISRDAIAHLLHLVLSAGAVDLPTAFAGGLVGENGPLRESLIVALRAEGGDPVTRPVDPCRGGLILP